jgi:hypothetical protein
LLKLLHRWRREAGQAGRNTKRIVVAFEAGRDGFWLARWLRARIETIGLRAPVFARHRDAGGMDDIGLEPSPDSRSSRGTPRSPFRAPAGGRAFEALKIPVPFEQFPVLLNIFPVNCDRELCWK